MSLKIFVTGATGYLGGSVVDRLLSHPDAEKFEITALVRSASKAEKLQTLGLKTVLGDYTNLDVVTKAASEADVVIEMANCDDLPGNTAILAGTKQRFEATGVAPILIHTSGSAFFAEPSGGLHGDVKKVFSDLESDAIEALPKEALHRHVDIPLVEADKEGYVKVYIIVPGTIFGVASGRLVDLGVQNTKSIQIPTFFSISIDRKRAGYIGQGKNVWPAVSVRDTADLLIRVFDAALADPASLGHGRDGHYVAENGSYSYEEVMKIAGQVLVDAGIAENPEPSSFTEEELLKYFHGWADAWATNCACRGDRSRALGWNPVDGKEAMLEGFKAEMLEVLRLKNLSN